MAWVIFLSVAPYMGGLLKIDSPTVVILHLLPLYASKDDVSPPQLVNVKVAEVAIFHGYPHFTSQPAVKVVALLVDFWFTLPEWVKKGVTHLFPRAHLFICQQPKGFPWAWLVRSYIGPTPLTEIAKAAPIFPALTLPTDKSGGFSVH